MKHVGPPVLLGFGRGSLPITLQAVMHTLFILASRPVRLSEVIRSMVVWCTDYGIESVLGCVLPVPLSDRFPYIPDIDRQAEAPAPLAVRDDMEDDFAPAAENLEFEFAGVAQPEVPGLHEQLYADVTGSFEVPGLLHVLHNLGRGLEDRLKEFKDAVFKLGKVCNVLRKKGVSRQAPTDVL